MTRDFFSGNTEEVQDQSTNMVSIGRIEGDEKFVHWVMKFSSPL